MPNPKGYIRDPDPPPEDAIVPRREPTMTDTAQERTERWPFATESDEAILGMFYSLVPHHDNEKRQRAGALRSELARRLRARQREEGDDFDPSMLDVLEEAAQKLTKRPAGEHGPLLMGLDRIKGAIRRHLDATPQREGKGEPVAWRWRLKSSSMGWVYWPEKPIDIAEPHDWDIQPLYSAPPAEREPEARLRKIAAIIQRAENRAMAADGPVTPTTRELTGQELRQIYRLAEPPADTEEGA